MVAVIDLRQSRVQYAYEAPNTLLCVYLDSYTNSTCTNKYTTFIKLVINQMYRSTQGWCGLHNKAATDLYDALDWF